MERRVEERRRGRIENEHPNGHSGKRVNRVRGSGITRGNMVLGWDIRVSPFGPGFTERRERGVKEGKEEGGEQGGRGRKGRQGSSGGSNAGAKGRKHR